MWPNAIILLFCALRCNIRIGRLWAIRCCAVHKSFLFSRLLLTVSTVSICAFTSFMQLLFPGNSFFVSPPLHHNHCLLLPLYLSLKKDMVGTWLVPHGTYGPRSSERWWHSHPSPSCLSSHHCSCQYRWRGECQPGTRHGRLYRGIGSWANWTRNESPDVQQAPFFLADRHSWKNIFLCFWYKRLIFALFLVVCFSCVFQDIFNQAREMLFLTPCHKLDDKSPFFTCFSPAPLHWPSRWLPQLSFLIQHATTLPWRAWSGFDSRFSVRLFARHGSFHRSWSFCSVSILTWERLPKSTRAW